MKRNRRRPVCTAFVIVLAALMYGQQKEARTFPNYQEMRKYIGQLYQEQKYAEAAEILEKGLTQFPDHLHANAFNLALMCLHLKDYEKGVRALNHALDHGVWFSVYDFLDDTWNPYKEQALFKTFMERNERERLRAQAKAEPKLEIRLPKDFKRDVKYPLFIALHGGGSNIATFEQSWTSPRMNTEFITAYVQSSQVVSMTGFSWTENMDTTKKELLDAYTEVTAEYPIDKSRVIIGGFSSGGVASLEIAFTGTFPVAGFIVLCPIRPDSFSRELVIKAKKRGLRGTILTTEMDGRVGIQKQMASLLKEEGFPYRFFITPNIGHWFPDDIDRRIDTAIRHIWNEPAENPVLHFQAEGTPVKPMITGLYLGQAPPGTTAEVFAPGIVSTDEAREFSCTFSPDGKEFYFAREVGPDKYSIFFMEETEKGWTVPRLAKYSGSYFNHEPYISLDGKRLYWGSVRPLPDGSEDYSIWVSEKTSQGWAEPKPLGFWAMYITETKGGSLYFTVRGRGGACLAKAESTPGGYGSPEYLGSPFISDYWDGHPFIAPDESYLIFDSENRPESDECGLFISFKKQDGTWTSPRNMKEKIKKGRFAMLSPDGRYLFFSSQGNIWWVDAKIIDFFRPEKRESQGRGN